DDGRMVALPGGVDDAEREGGGLHGGSQPGPGEAGMTLPLTPGCKVVAAHGSGESCALSVLHGIQQRRRMQLFVRCVESALCHVLACLPVMSCQRSRPR